MSANCLTQWSRLLVHSLVRAGVGHAVVSPGSRSTPLVYALQQVPALELHVIVDERAAGFFGLGLSKQTGLPTLLVCTSGSAAGHYLPALIEADESNTPLLVLSADRPHSLQANCAPQTIDQLGLFGGKVRSFVELGEPKADATALRALVRKAHQAVAASLGANPGPVHLNFKADKPLEPCAADTPDEMRLQAQVDALLDAPAPRHFAADQSPSRTAIAELIELAQRAVRPVFSFGPCEPQQRTAQLALASALAPAGWPVLAECTSQMRWLGEHSNDDPRLDAFDLVFGGRAAAKLRPDFALHFGAPLTSAGWAAQLETGAICLAVVTRAHWADPQNRAQLMLPADALQVAHALRGRLPAASESWRRLWQQASSRTAHAVEASLQELAGFAEPLVYRALDELLGEFDLLSLGNSLPVRLADSCLRSSKRQLTCLSQRGANGIDGAIASALGASSVERRPTLLVLGDVSALHDLGSLQLLKRVQHPFCVLVVNNGGGRIFEQLPAGRLPDLEPWITPHDFELWRVAAALGVSSVLVEGEAELKVALQAAARHRGATLIEARVAPSSALEWSGAARARVEAALAEL